MWRSPQDARRDAPFSAYKRHIVSRSQAAKELHDARILAPHFSFVPFDTRVTCRQRLGLHFKIDLCVDVGGIDGNMAQPGSDRIDVHAGTQKVRSGRVTDYMRTNPLLRQRRESLAGSLRVPFDQRMDSEKLGYLPDGPRSAEPEWPSFVARAGKTLFFRPFRIASLHRRVCSPRLDRRSSPLPPRSLWRRSCIRTEGARDLCAPVRCCGSGPLTTRRSLFFPDR